MPRWRSSGSEISKTRTLEAVAHGERGHRRTIDDIPITRSRPARRDESSDPRPRRIGSISSAPASAARHLGG